jgi:hypothetical protein
MISFADEQLDMGMQAASPLRRADREAFLKNVADALQGRVLGPGALHRVVRDCQRRYFDPPLET